MKGTFEIASCVWEESWVLWKCRAGCCGNAVSCFGAVMDCRFVSVPAECPEAPQEAFFLGGEVVMEDGCRFPG